MAKELPEFGGEERFAAPPEKLFNLLTNLDAMAATIPDLVSSEKVDDRTMNCVVRPGFSFLRGTMKMKITVTESQPHECAVMHIAAQGIGNSMAIDSKLSISPDGAGSKLNWTAKVNELKGLISAVGSTLITAAADKVIRDSWAAVRKELGETA